MKKLFSIKLVLAFAMVMMPLLLLARGQIIYTASFNASPSIGSKTIGGVTYSTVSYQGLSNEGELGNPSLPVNFIKFSVPINAKNFSVSALPTVCESLALDYPIYPIQAYWNGEVTQPNSGVYQSSSAYPSQMASVIDEGLIAGENHIVTVALFPMLYYPQLGNTLNIMSSIRLTLEYDLSDTLNVTPIIRKGKNLRNEGYDFVKGIVVNPEDVVGNAASSSNQQMLRFNPYDPSVNDTLENPETYLIITTPVARQPMRRLAALKMQKGMNVKIVTVNEALNDSVTGNGDYIPTGGDPKLTYTDDAGKIRNYLRTCYYDRGTEYVLLAGTDVPYRSMNGGQADMYYSELNVDWSLSTNEEQGRYGELFVGRLLGTQSQQFDNYSDKLLLYELNPGNGNPSYLKRALLTGGNPSQFITDDFVEITSDLWNSTTVISEDDVDIYPTGCDVLDSISTNHYGFISSFNQGYPSHMRVYGPEQGQNSKYIWALSDVKDNGITDNETDNGLDKMDNKSFPAIYFSPSGNTMSYNCLQNYGLEINYGESFTMGKNYGGPVYMGLTADTGSSYSYWYFGWHIGTAMVDGDGVLGHAFLTAKSYCTSWQPGWDKLVTCGNYLGDPALQMWRDIPQNYSNISVTRTDNTITISGVPANSTMVGYHSNDGMTGNYEATSSTVTLDNVSPNSTIMLYRNNYIPYIAPLVLQNTDLENSQYVIASEVTAGKSVDNNRTQGKVTVKSGADYEIEATGKVTFAGGFKVERGASLAVRKSSFKF